MDVQGAEAPSKGEMVFVADGLVTEEDDAVVQQGAPDRAERVVVERRAQIDAGDLGSDGRGQRLHPDALVRHGAPPLSPAPVADQPGPGLRPRYRPHPAR